MKQFIRNFRKQKTVGILNICGLSLGIMTSIVIGLWAINEFRFDDFHTNGENMYRSYETLELNGKSEKYASAFKPFGEEAIAKEPDIQQMCRVVPTIVEVWIDNTVYFDNKVFIADHNFFSFFNFPLKEGDVSTAFAGPDNVIIDEATATKYFPGQDAIGKTIRYSDKDFKVSAIMYNMPKNSHLQASMVFPFFGYREKDRWGGSDYYMTYFILNPNTNIKALEKSLTELYWEKMPIFKDKQFSIGLQKLKDIHFANDFRNAGYLAVGDKNLTLTFILVACVILAISCINFINLFVSTSFIRAKAIGIKKSFGANKSVLVYDFYKETAGYALIAIVLGVFLSLLVVPLFNRFTNSQLEIDFLSPLLYLFLLLLFVVVVFTAGSFPALYMTRFNTVETLTRKFRGKKLSLFQKVLIILQFTASIALLIIIFFINKQVDYMLHKDLGFDKENVIYVESRDDFGANYESLKDELLKEPSITDITMKNSLPTDWVQGWAFSRDGSDESILMELCRVKPNYFDFFGMKMVEGENPLNMPLADSLRYCVVNETAARLFKLDKDKENNIIYPNSIKDSPMMVEGIIRDAQTRSFHSKIDPQIYVKLGDENWWNNQLFFKVKGDPGKAIATIGKKWKELVPNVPFSYHFLDEEYNQLYTDEQNSSKILTGAMLISFIITVAGLFAMSYYAMQRRIKEIGIRKVNGATVADLLRLLSKDFIAWVCISFVIACPVAYTFVQDELDKYTVKTDLSLWVFLAAGAITLIVALLTVSWQTWRAATANPVDSIKNE